MITSPGDGAKLERRRGLRETHPLGSLAVVKMALLIACRYKVMMMSFICSLRNNTYLSRAMKDWKVSTAFIR